MNDELNSRFTEAQARVKTLANRPSNSEMLKLYAHFKQASEGDCRGEAPGTFDFVNRAKYDAWKGLEGLSKEQAAEAYISIVEDMMQ